MPDFNRWSPNEIRKAEAAAIDFLNGNIGQIAHTFEGRLNVIRRVTERMKSVDLGFEERMVCLSMIQELSRGMEESARDFFEIGCQPSVANLMKQVD